CRFRGLHDCNRQNAGNDSPSSRERAGVRVSVIDIQPIDLKTPEAANWKIARTRRLESLRYAGLRLRCRGIRGNFGGGSVAFVRGLLPFVNAAEQAVFQGAVI